MLKSGQRAFFIVRNQSVVYLYIIMSLHGSIKSFMRLCQFCGLAPISLKQTSKWEKSSHLKVISIVLIIFSGLILLIIIIWPESFLNSNDPKMQKALYFLLLISNHIPAMLALFELSIKWDQQVKLWNIFEKLDQLLKYHLNENVNYTNLKKKCNRLVLAWFYECFLLVIFYMLSKFQAGKNIKISYVATIFPFYLLTRLAFAYSTMLIIILHEYLDVLNKYLQSVNKQNGYYIRDQYCNRNNLRHFKWSKLIKSKSNLRIEILHSMKYIYCEIWNATEIVKNLTRWTLTMGLSNEFFTLNFNLYAITRCIFYKFLPIDRFSMLLVFVANNLCNLLLVSHYSNKLLENVSKTKITNAPFSFYRNFNAFRLCLGVFFSEKFNLYFN